MPKIVPPITDQMRADAIAMYRAGHTHAEISFTTKISIGRLNEIWKTYRDEGGDLPRRSADERRALAVYGRKTFTGMPQRHAGGRKKYTQPLDR